MNDSNVMHERLKNKIKTGRNFSTRDKEREIHSAETQREKEIYALETERDVRILTKERERERKRASNREKKKQKETLSLGSTGCSRFRYLSKEALPVRENILPKQRDVLLTRV